MTSVRKAAENKPSIGLNKIPCSFLLCLDYLLLQEAVSTDVQEHTSPGTLTGGEQSFKVAFAVYFVFLSVYRQLLVAVYSQIENKCALQNL